MKTYQMKKTTSFAGLLLAGLTLSSVSSLHAVTAVLVNDLSPAVGGTPAWFSSNVTPLPTRTGGAFLNVGINGPNATVFRAGWGGTGVTGILDVGEVMQLSFDIAHSASLLGNIRIGIINNAAANVGYGFSASLGASSNTAIYRTASTTSATATSYTAAGTPAALVGTDIATNFSTYKFTIERLDADSIRFEVFQNGGAALASTIQDYDGVSQPAAQLYNTFNRITVTPDTPVVGESFQLDNINLSIVTAVPEPSSFAVLGLSMLGLLVRRKR
jgi:PEP-CTERM motif